MKILLGVLALSLSTAFAEPSSGGSVSLPLGDFQELWEKSRPAEVPAPVVPFSILRADWKLAYQDGVLRGNVEFEVQVFQAGKCRVPLLPSGVILVSVQPSDAHLAIFGDHLVFLPDSPGKHVLTFQVALEGNGNDGQWASPVVPTAAVLNRVAIDSLPEGVKLAIPGAIPGGQGIWHVPSGANWQATMALPGKTMELPPAVSLPPVVTAASARMKVVPDGALLCNAGWTVRHSSPGVFPITLPPDSRLVSCEINGVPAAPPLDDKNTLSVRLPDKGGNFKVELTYTGKTRAFEPVRGDVTLALPSSPLLIERWEWTLQIPAAYEPVALDGNVESLPSQGQGEIRLVKEITTDDAPSVRIFYQKPETTKKP